VARDIYRQRIKDDKPYTHARIAHDDISISVNRETRLDRLLTRLTCSVRADIGSGYVFYCDVDFDPTINPPEIFEETDGSSSNSVNLRKPYQNAKETFTAPLMHFQRATARYYEPALFAVATGKLHQFAARADKAFDAVDQPPRTDASQAMNDAKQRADEIEHLRDNWFNLVTQERHGRSSFEDIMTRDTYRQAASRACLKDMVPPGKINLIGDQEDTMVRVMPRVFRE
jgi:hypothetical protein